MRVVLHGGGSLRSKARCFCISPVSLHPSPSPSTMEAKQPPSSRFAGALLPQASATKPGAKKLVIKQYAEKPKLPETFDVDTWARLSGKRSLREQNDQTERCNWLQVLLLLCCSRCPQAILSRSCEQPALQQPTKRTVYLLCFVS